MSHLAGSIESDLASAIASHSDGLARGDATRLESAANLFADMGSALLAAQGMTNKEIAGRLSASVRTVEGHLYQVFAKLGVASRRDLDSSMIDALRE